MQPRSVLYLTKMPSKSLDLDSKRDCADAHMRAGRSLISIPRSRSAFVALSPARGSPRTRKSITACRCSRSGAAASGQSEPGRHCRSIGACLICRSSTDPPTWRNAGWNRRRARGCGRLKPQNATPTLPGNFAIDCKADSPMSRDKISDMAKVGWPVSARGFVLVLPQKLSSAPAKNFHDRGHLRGRYSRGVSRSILSRRLDLPRRRETCPELTVRF